MAGILEGKKGLIFGALNDKSIAWKAAEAAVREGASIVLTNTAMALRFGTMDELAQKCSAPVVVADATSIEDLEKLVDETMAHFGGKFDFVLHSVGMSPNIRKNIPYETLNYDFLSKTLDISAVSFHKLLKVLYAKDALNDNGSGVALSYIAAGKAGASVSYALGQGAPMVAAIWGIFIWKEFKGAKKPSKRSQGQHRLPVSDHDLCGSGNSRYGQDVRLR